MEYLSELCYRAVLALSGMELTVFTAACELCVGFVAKPVLVTHQCFVFAEGCLHSVKAFPLATPESRQEVVTVHSSDLGWLKGYAIPCNVLLSSKNRGRRRTKGWFLASKVAIAWSLAGHWSLCGRR